MFDPNDFDALASSIISVHDIITNKLADEIDMKCVSNDRLLEALDADRIVFFLAGFSSLARRHEIPLDREDIAQIINTITDHNGMPLLCKYLPVDEFIRLYGILEKYQ